MASAAVRAVAGWGGRAEGRWKAEEPGQSARAITTATMGQACCSDASLHGHGRVGVAGTLTEDFSSSMGACKGKYLDFDIMQALIRLKEVVITATILLPSTPTNFVVNSFAITIHSPSKPSTVASKPAIIVEVVLLQTAQRKSVPDRTECSECTQVAIGCTIGSAFEAMKAIPIKVVDLLVTEAEMLRDLHLQDFG